MMRIQIIAGIINGNKGLTIGISLNTLKNKKYVIFQHTHKRFYKYI